jgi:hypothetical protein
VTASARVRVAAVFGVLLCATSSFAQVAQPPPRPSRPRFGGGPAPDPNRVRHDLLFDASLLGGYQDNTTPFGTKTTGVPPRPSATITAGSLGLQYSVGTQTKGFDLTGRGTASYASTYRAAGQPPGYGGDLAASGQVGLGRHTRLAAFQSVQVSPFASLGIFGGLNGNLASGTPSNAFRGTIPGVEANLANALFEGMTWATHTAGSLDHEWTRRMSTVVGYMFNRQAHEDRTLLDNRTHVGRLSFNRKVGRSGTVTASYSGSVADVVQRGRSATTENHTIRLGGGFSREISRTRTLSISGGSGGSHIDSRGPQVVRQRYWLPNAYGTANLDVGRSWTVAVDWRQSANHVPSPVFGPQTFLSRSANVSLGGHIRERIELVFSAANSNGTLGRRLPGEEGEYKGYTGNAQVRVGLTRWWSAIASINHYQAVLSGAAAALLETSEHFHTNSVMVGFGWSVPLFSTASERGRPRSGRN